jgi:hypothetical protein
MLAGVMMLLVLTVSSSAASAARLTYSHPQCDTVARWEIAAAPPDAALPGDSARLTQVENANPGCVNGHGDVAADVTGGFAWRFWLRALAPDGSASAWSETADGKGYLDVFVAGDAVTTTTTVSSSSSSSMSSTTTRTTTATTAPPVTAPVVFTPSTTTVPPGCTTVQDLDARTLAGAPATPYPVSVTTPDGACVLGGTVRGTFAATTTWQKATHPDNACVVITRSRGAQVVGTRCENVGDGIRFRDRTAGWAVRGVRLTGIRDACIDDGRVFGGTIDDALLDGCYVGVNARPAGGVTRNGSGEVIAIRRSLIRLQPFPRPEQGPTPGHGAFCAQHAHAPHLSITDSIFRLDQIPGPGRAAAGFGGKITDCARNTMVWLGPGPYPTTLPAGFTVTRDRAVWDAAVAAWTAAHP